MLSSLVILTSGTCIHGWLSSTKSFNAFTLIFAQDANCNLLKSWAWWVSWWHQSRNQISDSFGLFPMNKIRNDKLLVITRWADSRIPSVTTSQKALCSEFSPTWNCYCCFYDGTKGFVWFCYSLNEVKTRFFVLIVFCFFLNREQHQRMDQVQGVL